MRTDLLTLSPVVSSVPSSLADNPTPTPIRTWHSTPLVMASTVQNFPSPDGRLLLKHVLYHAPIFNYSRLFLLDRDSRRQWKIKFMFEEVITVWWDAATCLLTTYLTKREFPDYCYPPTPLGLRIIFHSHTPSVTVRLMKVKT